MPGHTTIYAHLERPLTTEEIRPLVATASVRPAPAGTHGVTVAWPDVAVTFQEMEAETVARHLDGVVGFLRAKTGEPPPSVEARLRSARQVLGVTVEPGFDDAGRVEALVHALARTRDAVLLRVDRITDSAGETLMSLRPAPIV